MHTKTNKKNMLYKIISVVLCVCLVVTGIHFAGKKEDIYGVNNDMSFAFKDSSTYNFSIYGEGGMITTYNDNGYKTTLKVGSQTAAIAGSDNGIGTLDGVKLTTKCVKLTDSNFISVTYELKNTTSSTKTVSVATEGDIKINSNDKATVHNLDGNRGFWMAEGLEGKDNIFNMVLRDSYGVTDVDKYWYGPYGQRETCTWAGGTGDSESYSDLSNVDSYMSFSWQNRQIGPNQTLNLSFGIGVGEMNNPPVILQDDSHKLYLNGKEINAVNNIAAGDGTGSHGLPVTKNTKLTFEGNVRDNDAGDTISLKYAIYQNHSIVDGPYDLVSSDALSGGNVVSFSVSDRLSDLSNSGEYTIVLWAQDSRGAMSSTKSFKIRYIKGWLKATSSNDKNGITNQAHLSWEAGGSTDTSYKLYRRKYGESSANRQLISSNSYNGVSEIKVLQVYPISTNNQIFYNVDARANFATWVDNINNMRPSNYPLINLTSVSSEDFDNDIKRSEGEYFKKTNGKYKYDIIIFGFMDSNGLCGLSNNAYEDVKKFIIAGNSVIFGHDTILACAGMEGISEDSNFTKLGKEFLNIDVVTTTGAPAYKYVRIPRSSVFTTVPFNIEDEDLAPQKIKDQGLIIKDSAGNTFFGPIPDTHHVNQIALDKSEIFLEGWSDTNGDGIPDKKEIDPQDESWYLLVHNNCAMIQTGHTSGGSTLAEQAVIGNLIYYMYPYSSTEVDDTYANDISKPAKPSVVYDEDNTTDTNIKYTVKASDIGTNYYYDIEMYDKSDLNTILNKRNDVSVEVKSGLKRMEYQITQSSTPPTSTTGWTTVTASDGVEKTISVSQSKNDGTYYLHIRGVDKAGNVGEIQTKHINEAHKVTYDYTTNGGTYSNASEKRVNVGKDIDLTPTASKDGDTGIYSASNPDGWQFVGWNTNKDATTALTSLKMGSSDVTLYAIYKKQVKLTEVYYDDDSWSTCTTEHKGNVFNNSTEREFTTDEIKEYPGWTIRGWSSTVCGGNVTWEKSIVGNHPWYNECPDCGGTMTHNHASPVDAGTCDAGHRHLLWATDTSNSAKCNSCGKTFTYNIVGDNDLYTTCPSTENTRAHAGVGISDAGKVKISQDTTIYALYEKNVTATFRDYNGTTARTVIKSETKYTSAYSIWDEEIPSITLPSVATYTGWTSRGWATSTAQSVPAGVIKSAGSSHDLVDDITFYAQYEKNLKATFIDYNGTTQTTQKDEQKAYTNSYAISSVAWPYVTFPSRSSYTGDSECGNWITDGWSAAGATAADAATSFNAGSKTQISEDSTYYGLWHRTITLSYEQNGGNVRPWAQSYVQKTNAYNITNYSSQSFVLAGALTKKGFTFDGWRENGLDGTKYDPGATYVLTHVTTMHAAWTRNSYRVIYNYTENGGTSTTAGSNVYVAYESNISFTPTATKNGDTGVYSASNPDGWQFVGWNTDKDATVGMSSLVMGTEDVTLYAIFKKNISLKQIDISGNQNTEKVLSGEVFNKGTSRTEKLSRVSSSATVGYDSASGAWTIRGWSPQTAADPSTVYNNLSDFTYTQDTTLYALYSRDISNKFISYKGTERNQNEIKGKQYLNVYMQAAQPSVTTVSVTAPSAELYTGDGTWRFVSWIQNPQTTNETAYNVGDTISGLSRGVTLYAKYERDLTIEYLDMLQKTQKTTTETYKQYTCSNNISTRVSPKATLKTANERGDKFEFIGWSTSDSGTSVQYTKEASVTLTKNLKLYAIYRRGLDATFHKYNYAGQKDDETVSNSQYINSNSPVTAELPSVSITIPSADNTISLNGKSWNFGYWTKGTGNSGNTAIEDRRVTITEDTDFYAVYDTTYTTTFYTIDNEIKKREAITSNASVNANNIASPDYGTITSPKLKTAVFNGENWAPLGFSVSTSSSSSIALNGNTSLAVNDDITYYAIYENNTPVTFIDYNGSAKTERKVDAKKFVNAGSMLSSDISVTTPTQNTYSDANGSWTPAGWTDSKNVRPDTVYDQNKTYSLEPGATYYGLYKKDITLYLTTYSTTYGVTPKTEEKHADARVNSSNIASVSQAIFTLPAISTYIRNEKTYTGYGWNLDGETGTEKSKRAGTDLYLTGNEHYYALYNSPVTVYYNGNGGTCYTSPQTINQFISAAGESYKTPIQITNDLPVRNGYVFLNKWSSIQKDPDGAGYVPGSQYEFDDDTTLYAQWGIESVDKKVRINWEDNGNATDSRPDEVRLFLYRNGEKVTSHLVSKLDDTVAYPSSNRIIDGAGVKISVAKSGNTNEYTFEGLQKYDPATGTAYTYTVQEEPFEAKNSQTKYDITVNQTTGIITNTLKDAGNKIVKANIRWVDETDKWNLRPSFMKLNLEQTDPDTGETKVVSSTIVTVPDKIETFEYLFNGQEAINSNGHSYDYSIVVEDIVHYSRVSTKETGADNVTICNFVFTLESVSESFTGGDRNHIVISADAYSSKNNQIPAGIDDYLTIESDDDRVFMITFKPLKKSINVSTGQETYSSSYLKQTIDKRTNLPIKNGTSVPSQYCVEKQVIYNVTVTPRYNVILEGLPDGKYEIEPHNDSLFDFDKFIASAAEIKNATLAKENGKWYLTFSSLAEYSEVNKLHMNMITRPWRGYTDYRNIFKWIINREDVGYKE